ncbi:TRAP transporter large permease subunit [Rhizobium sp. SSA_523]|uniref:TRAP transporter large permease n=1 Tax=Rhizobium sp. SSA_523 TaxID=2952477 RepID=UPI0020909A0E|nr:TRAP transporter large permease subunit [Rhizobium sp. SSA_523]MCO5731404.1 TRAP transporter large permease subunit [Rhizobium sp. SSA_523]WKC22071.1 TRAP transporter large permease subunit [Rhizobium sp. SSA_523]
MASNGDVLVLDGDLLHADAPSGSRFMRPIEGLAALLLVVMIGLLLLGVSSRYALHLPIVWIDEAASFCFLWFAMMGAAIAIDRNEHLRLTLFLNMMPERVIGYVNALALVLVATFLGAMLMPSIEYVMEEWAVSSAALNVPMSFRASALPFGIVLMLVLVLANLFRTATLRHVLLAVATVALVGSCLWLLFPVFEQLGNVNIAIFLCCFAAIFLALGVPIAFCFGLGALSFLVFTTWIPLIVMVGRVDEGMSGIILLSVPIFVLLGCVLDATGMGKAIVDLLSTMFGHVRAGMSWVLLGSLFLVSGISGSKVSDMATVAPALFPEMKRRGHKPKEMIALLATGAAMADTVPPSIVLIVLGSAAGISIAALFTSGFLIAMVLLIVLAILARIKARHENMEGAVKASWSFAAKAALVAAPALVLPFLIRSLVGGGVATATEVSTIAVLYAMVIGAILYGGISLRKLYAMLVETAALSGSILIILGTASAMAWSLTQTGFAFQLSTMIAGLPGGWVTYMIVSILIFMLLGCVLEGLPAIVLLAPIMFPIAKAVGINDVHYAMVVVVAMNIGLMAPPIGIGFYIACKIGNVSPDEAMGAIWPYLAAMLVGLLIIAFVPALSTVLI